jgi:hypothetical protein
MAYIPRDDALKNVLFVREMLLRQQLAEAFACNHAGFRSLASFGSGQDYS